jgi:polyphosphate kinase 2 (PPK2 family)
VLQALDGGGKDGLIRKVITAFNPQGTRVTGFVVPTEEELRHDFLWRVPCRRARQGRIGVFNRSHYEDVLVVRVKELVPESVWQDRYRQINDFEAMLAANSTRIVKFYLHISRDEQKERFVKRLQDPKKGWKWDSADLRRARSGPTTRRRTWMRWSSARPMRRRGSSSRPTTSGIGTLPSPRSWRRRHARWTHGGPSRRKT